MNEIIINGVYEFIHPISVDNPHLPTEEICYVGTRVLVVKIEEDLIRFIQEGDREEFVMDGSFYLDTSREVFVKNTVFIKTLY